MGWILTVHSYAMAESAWVLKQSLGYLIRYSFFTRILGYRFEPSHSLQWEEYFSIQMLRNNKVAIGPKQSQAYMCTTLLSIVKLMDWVALGGKEHWRLTIS